MGQTVPAHTYTDININFLNILIFAHAQLWRSPDEILGSGNFLLGSGLMKWASFPAARGALG